MLLLADPLPDLMAGPGRLHVCEPVARGFRLLARHDLDRVAVLEGAVQRRDPAVDASALAVLADLGVHGEGEVDRRRPRSEEHTSELQSRLHLVCRLLLEKKKTI